MRITVIGATGMVGQRVVAEAARRGHQVTAVSRSGSAVPDAARAIAADASDAQAISALLAPSDAVVNAVRGLAGREDSVADTTKALLDAAATHGLRVLVVGGAGPLRSPNGVRVVDDESYVAPQWRASAVASVKQWEICQGHPGDWIYLCPPALLRPGARTGQYRRGTTALLCDDDGASRVSAEDLAVAVVDELEKPVAERQFTVAY